MKKITNSLIAFFASLALFAFAAEPTLQDFLTPLQDGAKAPAKPKQPDKIKKSEKQLTKDGDKTTVVEGADIQDAAAAASIELEEEEDDVTVFEAPGGGVGVMARGTADYRKLNNRNASLISKRLAYVRAYINAKVHMANHIHGLRVDAAQNLVESIDQYDTANDSLANTSVVFNETNKQKLEGLLHGYVLYKVETDEKKEEVAVTIAVTPVTRGATIRATPAMIVARDLATGMEQVLVELKSGAVPPICGRIIDVVNDKGDQDLYFVGFGSAIIPTNKNKTVEKRLGQAARKRAQMRARASLVGLIMGDQLTWSIGMDAQTLDQQKQFDVKGDPLMDGEGVIPIEGTLDIFRNRIQQTDAFRAAQKGQLPPGISPPQNWKSKDGDWFMSAYVYNPKMTAAGRELKKAIDEGPTILERGNEIAGGKPPKGGIFADKSWQKPIGGFNLTIPLPGGSKRKK